MIIDYIQDHFGAVPWDNRNTCSGAMAILSRAKTIHNMHRTFITYFLSVTEKS